MYVNNFEYSLLVSEQVFQSDHDVSLIDVLDD